MLRFCISDLHLGDRGSRDGFNVENRERQFFDFLNYVQGQEGWLYILGDLLDFWETNLSRAVMAYLPLLNRLSQLKIRYIPGNHDSSFYEFIGRYTMPDIPVIELSEKPFLEEIGGKKFYFCHGHEIDDACSTLNPGIGNITAVMTALLEDKNKGPVYNGEIIADKFIGALEVPLDIWRHVLHQKSRQEEILDKIIKYREQQSADVLIFGHTHNPGTISSTIVNTGSWVSKNNTFVKISDDGIPSLHEWVDNGPVPFENKLR
jgi:UDP-2,3-diacylglucosamine pyrophosphatase LpxH